MDKWWNVAHDKLASQAQRASFAIKCYAKPFGNFPIKEHYIIFETMIKPILCYGLQMWGYEFSPTIESVHNVFCKGLLNVRNNTNTSMVLGECGRLLLCITST
jgi:hypothetical protein